MKSTSALFAGFEEPLVAVAAVAGAPLAAAAVDPDGAFDFEHAGADITTAIAIAVAVVAAAGDNLFITGCLISSMSASGSANAGPSQRSTS
jgi:hypothetical protein